MKEFNTAGTCRPNEHYMVDITERLEIIRKMIAKGNYFCINRGRQYGKTTTLNAITCKLTDEYCVFSISFEAIDDACYADETRFYANFASKLADAFEWTPVKGLDAEVEAVITTFVEKHEAQCTEKELSRLISTICFKNTKPVVLLIDEVDQAGNYPTFLKLLALLRRMYLNRGFAPTFQSVILAGVYDVKNLKLKMRPEEQHQYNSPWNVCANESRATSSLDGYAECRQTSPYGNIAVPFDVDMSLSAKGIAGMLAEYKADHNLSFDEVFVAQMIRDYTSGYPFLVSRICQIIDAEGWTWDKDGVLKAVNAILVERNTLFDNMIKNLDVFPELKQILKGILLSGIDSSYNPDEKYVQIAAMFNYITNKEGKIAVACRIMETRLYNLFIKEEEHSVFYKQGQIDKSQFVHDGIIDMPRLLERFVVHMNQTYKMDHDHEFIENDARKVFLTYLRPVINGIGSYHIEEQTRDHDRMDVVVDYLGKQYVIELKIWRGNAYNERGEEQLCRYLEYFDLQEGYLLSFCFNKIKQSGLLPPTELNGRTLIEAIV